MYRYIVISLLALVLVSGCASTPKGVEGRMLNSFEQKTTRAVASVGYDEYGRPVFGQKLKKRKLKVGDSFILVRYQSGRPVETYDVLVTEPDDPDYVEPIREVGRWTKKGFVVGVAGGYIVLQVALDGVNSGDEENDDADEVLGSALVLSVFSVAIGTVGGFVIGVGNGLYSLGEQIGLESAEMKLEMLAYHTLMYDGRGRLKTIIDYPASQKNDFTRTEFLYKGESDVPFAMEKTDRWGHIIESGKAPHPL